jgi:hypothetical protein
MKQRLFHLKKPLGYSRSKCQCRVIVMTYIVVRKPGTKLQHNMIHSRDLGIYSYY